MVSHQWRRFAFFSKDLVKDENGEAWSGLQDRKVTCTTSGKGRLVIGDSEGYLHLISQNMKVSRILSSSIFGETILNFLLNCVRSANYNLYFCLRLSQIKNHQILR